MVCFLGYMQAVQHATVTQIWGNRGCNCSLGCLALQEAAHKQGATVHPHLHCIPYIAHVILLSLFPQCLIHRAVLTAPGWLEHHATELWSVSAIGHHDTY